MLTLQYVFLLVNETHKQRKKRHLFAFGHFSEVLKKMPCFFESRHIHATMTMYDWPTPSKQFQGGSVDAIKFKFKPLRGIS